MEDPQPYPHLHHYPQPEHPVTISISSIDLYTLLRSCVLVYLTQSVKNGNGVS